MSRIKRFTAGILSRVDWMIVQVENHEALVNSAIRDLQQGLARAQVQLARVNKDGQALTRKLESEREAQRLWKERALRTEDGERALACLRRSKRADAKIPVLEERLTQHERTEQQLERDIGALHERLSELKEQRNTMRTRESRAAAMGVVSGTRQNMSGEIEEIFERWETSVAEAEIEGGCSLETKDELEEEFLTQEEEDVLRAELDELRGSS